jgi:hypothetical protein
MFGFTDITELIGKKVNEITRGENGDGDYVLFTCEDGSVYKMYHSQDCCERVYIEDICGDLNSLTKSPILDAYESTNENLPPKYEKYGGPDSYTWTFYVIRNLYETVTIRWYGTSNGYYSETADFCKVN